MDRQAKIIKAYFDLTQLMEDIDYYNKHPSRRYLKESIEKAPTLEDKVRIILEDGFIQKEILPNWLTERYKIKDMLEYYLDRMK